MCNDVQNNFMLSFCHFSYFFPLFTDIRMIIHLVEYVCTDRAGCVRAVSGSINYIVNIKSGH